MGVDDLTKPELQSIAAAYNLPVRSNASARTLREAISEHEARLGTTTVESDESDTTDDEVVEPPVRAAAIEATSAAYDEAFDDETEPVVAPAAGLAAPAAPTGVTASETVPDAAQVPTGRYPQENGWSVYANGGGLRADCPNCGHSHNAGEYAKCPGCGFAAPASYSLPRL